MKMLMRFLVPLALVTLFGCTTPEGADQSIAVTPADDLAQVVADAPSGAVLDLADGTYAVAIPLEINKSITLRGSDPSRVAITNAGNTPALKGQSLGAQALGDGPAMLLVSAGTFTASGITFEYEGTVDANVVTVRDASVDIDDCVFKGGVRTQATIDSETYLGVGLDLLGSATGTVSSSLFTSNDGDGVRAAGTSDVSIVESEASANSIGITVEDDATPTLQGNDASRNSIWGIFYVSDGSGTASGNTITDNTNEGVMIQGSAGPTLSNNTVRDNGGKGIWVRENATATLTANTIDGNGNDAIGFEDAGSGAATDNIIGRNNTALGIRVGSTGPVAVSGNTVSNIFQVGIFFDTGSAGSATGNTVQNTDIQGIVVAGDANVSVTDNTVLDSGQEGIRVEGSVAGEISGNVLSGNHVGVRIVDAATPDITDNTMTGNEIGVEYFDNAAGTLDNNVIELSTFDGVRVSGSSTPTIEGNTIDENGGCGIRLLETSDPTLTGNTFSGNGTGTTCDERVP